MRAWLDEAIKAPLDAWGVLLGLATAFGILALVRHEFSSDPLSTVLGNWTYWSHTLWGSLAALVKLAITPVTTNAMTLAILSYLVVWRGKMRGQAIAKWQGHTLIGSIPMIVFSAILLVILLGGVLFAVVANIDNKAPLANATWIDILAVPAVIFTASNLYRAITETPRSFFGIVIAALALLLLDQIPLFPAA